MPKINPSKNVHGEVIYYANKNLAKFKKEAAELMNLKLTSAGQKAQELDKADGVVDGEISASVWNKYANEHGGKSIKNKISVNDAMNSITKYEVSEAKQKVDAQKTALENKNEDGEQQAPEMGL